MTRCQRFFFFFLTSNLSSAGVASVLPAASVARTKKVCLPFFSFFRVVGDLHEAKSPLSTAHSKLEFDSVELNL